MIAQCTTAVRHAASTRIVSYCFMTMPVKVNRKKMMIVYWNFLSMYLNWKQVTVLTDFLGYRNVFFFGL